MRIDNVADLIAETLAQAGVKRIFGVSTWPRPIFCRARRIPIVDRVTSSVWVSPDKEKQT